MKKSLIIAFTLLSICFSSNLFAQLPNPTLSKKECVQGGVRRPFQLVFECPYCCEYQSSNNIWNKSCSRTCVPYSPNVRCSPCIDVIDIIYGGLPRRKVVVHDIGKWFITTNVILTEGPDAWIYTLQDILEEGNN